MEQLAQRFDKGLSGQLPADQLAIGHSFAILADEHLYWGLVWWRYKGDTSKAFHNLANWLPPKMVITVLGWLFSGRVDKLLKMHGIGRHTDEEILNICRNDLKAISKYLGSKPFLMGDDPCEVDCSVFGMIGQIVWNAPDSPLLIMAKEEFPNLHEYCLRMKQRAWPDWDKHLLPVR
ncbi:unnamed protein product [Meganyctiphanes norvegica]|uniref:Metaxin glutathione S-transferase domain-containing protein n=1 Tax=Meganyctiphanes norvegica TaxID=48144 RepID=A0AAV2R5S9_MEGNR